MLFFYYSGCFIIPIFLSLSQQVLLCAKTLQQFHILPINQEFNSVLHSNVLKERKKNRFLFLFLGAFKMARLPTYCQYISQIFYNPFYFLPGHIHSRFVCQYLKNVTNEMFTYFSFYEGLKNNWMITNTVYFAFKAIAQHR